MRPDTLILSCEHASRHVPGAFKDAFRSTAARRALMGHRGSDIGALRVARAFQRAFAVPLFTGRMTRLLVDLNRSLGHPRLFSEFSRPLDADRKRRLLEHCHAPYRSEVRQAIRKRVLAGARVIHVSVHSFSQRWEGRNRDTDVGLLYDPARAGEAKLVNDWILRLRQAAPQLSIRKNQPYRGTSDGFTRELRGLFADRRYVGIELEVSQRFFTNAPSAVRRALVRALLLSFPGPRAAEVSAGDRRT